MTNFERRFEPQLPENEKIEKSEATPALEQTPETVKEKEPLEKLKEYIKSISAELREQKIFVDERGRINIDKFKGIYPRSSIEDDKQYVKEHKEIFKRADMSKRESQLLFYNQEAKEKELKKKKLSEICEMLVTAILHKNLKENFVVVRTSEYDDIRNGIDTVILDKNTGSIVCAVDEIDETSGLRFDEKRKKIMEKNCVKGGGLLKYGLFFERGKEDMKLKKGLIDNVPLFYYAISKDKIKSAIEGFTPFQTVSTAEKTIFESFLRSSLEQINLLKNEHLHPKLKERLELFEKSVAQHKML